MCNIIKTMDKRERNTKHGSIMHCTDENIYSVIPRLYSSNVGLYLEMTEYIKWPIVFIISYDSIGKHRRKHNAICNENT